MNKVLLFILIFPCFSLAQNSLDCIQGIAVKTVYNGSPADENPIGTSYRIINQFKELSFNVETIGEIDSIQYIFCSKVGFINSKGLASYRDSLRYSGEYFATLYYKDDCLQHPEDELNISEYFDCGESYYETCGKVAECIYTKINDLPYSVYVSLYKYQKKSGCPILVTYLDQTVRSVCTDQVDVFDGMSGTQKGYLVRGDLVEIIAEQGDWAHIKYLKTNKEYWTYQSCLE